MVEAEFYIEMRDNVKQIRVLMRNHKVNLIPLGVSMLILLYFILFLVPYARSHGFLNGNLTPDDNEGFIYGLLSFPVMLLYLIYIILAERKITFLRSIFYPLIIINLYFGIFLCLIRSGGTVLWLMVFTIMIPIVLVPLLFILGLVWDIRYCRQNKKERG